MFQVSHSPGWANQDSRLIYPNYGSIHDKRPFFTLVSYFTNVATDQNWLGSEFLEKPRS